MIKKIWINNFRGIKKGEVSLSPLTVLLGANNSGKTTILEALFLAPNPFRKVPYYEKRYERAVEIVHSLHETLDSKGYTFLLHNYTTKEAEIEFDINGNKYLLQFIRDDPYIYVHTNEEKEDHRRITINGKERKIFGRMQRSTASIKIYDPNLFIENTLLISANLTRAGYRYLKVNWASIINLGICRKVAEETSILSRDKYKDITIEPFLGGELSIYAYLEDGRRIRLGDLGEGIQNYMLARILYEVEKPNILLWDDVESHFNPRMILSVAEWFTDLLEGGKQIILTTHSIEAAKMIASLNEDKARICLISLKNGVLKAKAHTLKEVEELLEAGIDMRMAEPLLL